MPAERSQRFGRGSIPEARSWSRRWAFSLRSLAAGRCPRRPADRHRSCRRAPRSRARSTGGLAGGPSRARLHRTSSLRIPDTGRPSRSARRNGSSPRPTQQRGQVRLDEPGSVASEASICSSSLGLRLKKKTSPRSSHTPLQLLQTSTRTPPLVIVSTSDGSWQCGQFMVQTLLDSSPAWSKPFRAKRAR